MKGRPPTYRHRAQATITTEQHILDYCRYQKWDFSTVFRIGFETMLKKDGGKGPTPELYDDLIAVEKQKIAESEEKIEEYNFMRNHNKRMVDKENLRTAKVNEAFEKFIAPLSFRSKLPDHDPYGDHLNWWEDQAKECSEFAGFQVEPRELIQIGIKRDLETRK